MTNKGNGPEARASAFAQADRELLSGVGVIAQGIARQFGEYCEVVVHSLENYENSIVALENGQVTGRSVGGPMTDFALNVLERCDQEKQDVYGVYYTGTETGKNLKSTTIVIRNLEGRPIGLLCMNFDISAPFAKLMESLLPQVTGTQKISEHFPLTPKDLVETSFNEVVEEINRKVGISPIQKNKLIVEELYKRGIFNIKNGIDIVSEKLGVSRYTVYNYIREVKAGLGENEREKLYT
ncbi:MAG: PAS domain-containing protein [Spirochaetaceae bacterium]|nr:PAS domain-containing protein [Spirochaetaceae bacterium]MCF7949515.1 PAS domain-containing protein [Spirochaetia bacterium]MCF7951339.1 PAS domain-containing protein [Spirochaetaceae bacterium]